ncbi:unnamed protein product [Orchesella dallaii]|uniref:Retrotransposon gag domain-containing protein n=1 Tax=Orchesella dallaii TaxID=48710 RepID=A0ABP1R6T4_9HEXA
MEMDFSTSMDMPVGFEIIANDQMVIYDYDRVEGIRFIRRDDQMGPMLLDSSAAEETEVEIVAQPSSLPAAPGNMEFLSRTERKCYLREVASNPQIPQDVKNENCLRYLKKLHKSCKNGENEINEELLAKCMTKTLKLRWFEIVQLRLGLQTIVKHFPPLRNFNQIRQEFQRITKRDVKEFEARFHDLLYGTTSISFKSASEWQKLLHFIKSNVSAPFGSEFLTYFFRVEDEGTKIKNLHRKNPTIVIFESVQKDNCASVYCEKVKIVSGLSFHMALLAAYYLHKIFFLRYLKDDETLWEEMDKI